MSGAPNPAPLVEAPAKRRRRTAQGRRPLRGAVQVLPLLMSVDGRPSPVGGFSTKQLQDSREFSGCHRAGSGPSGFSGCALVLHRLKTPLRHPAEASLSVPAATSDF